MYCIFYLCSVYNSSIHVCVYTLCIEMAIFCFKLKV